MQSHSLQKLLCCEQRVTLVQKLVCARHVPSVCNGSVKPIKASQSAAVPASMEGYQILQRCTSGSRLSIAFPIGATRDCRVVCDICRIE